MNHLPRKGHHHQRRASRELAILYEDDSVVVVNKPPGLLAVPVKSSDAPSAMSVLSTELKRSRQHVWIVHRIDRFTSGILLFAKTERDRDALIQQFLAHTPVRQYLAVVRGHLREKQGTLIHYLRKVGMFQKLVKQNDREATRAELKYLVERPLRAASLVRITLITGLQNQIRAQFFAIGHPVIGDRKYSPSEASEKKIARVALHASHLEFIHPRSGKTVCVDCDPPADFQALIRALSFPSQSN
jgi:RluA family pseudouridine synthase